MLLVEREWIQPQDFITPAQMAVSATQYTLPPEGVNLDEVERQLVVQALDRTAGNQTHAGRLLGINRDQVRYRIEKFGLHHREEAAGVHAAGRE
jgi:two-component system NtrC family response regulator